MPALHVHGVQRIGKIIRDPSAVAGDRDRARAFAGQLDSLPHADEERQIVRHIRRRARRGGVVTGLPGSITAGILASFSRSAGKSTTLNSWVPACVTSSCRPSRVHATAQGVDAPESMLSNNTVLSSFISARLMMLPALVLIQPRSICVVGR